MKDISLIMSQLRDRQTQIDRKINQQLVPSVDPLTFDRLDKSTGHRSLQFYTNWDAYQRTGNRWT